MQKKIEKILFLCVANSARSQIAEAIAKIILPANIKVMSAGSSPVENIHPLAIKVLLEYGVDVTLLKPKSISSLPQGFMDQSCLAIRLCAEEQCPMIDSKLNILDWSMSDPTSSESQLKAFEEAARLITAKLIALNNSL